MRAANKYWAGWLRHSGTRGAAGTCRLSGGVGSRPPGARYRQQQGLTQQARCDPWRSRQQALLRTQCRTHSASQSGPADRKGGWGGGKVGWGGAFPAPEARMRRAGAPPTHRVSCPPPPPPPPPPHTMPYTLSLPPAHLDAGPLVARQLAQAGDDGAALARRRLAGCPWRWHGGWHQSLRVGLGGQRLLWHEADMLLPFPLPHAHGHGGVQHGGGGDGGGGGGQRRAAQAEQVRRGRAAGSAPGRDHAPRSSCRRRPCRPSGSGAAAQGCSAAVGASKGGAAMSDGDASAAPKGPVGTSASMPCPGRQGTSLRASGRVHARQGKACQRNWCTMEELVHHVRHLRRLYMVRSVHGAVVATPPHSQQLLRSASPPYPSISSGVAAAKDGGAGEERRQEVACITVNEGKGNKGGL